MRYRGSLLRSAIRPDVKKDASVLPFFPLSDPGGRQKGKNSKLFCAVSDFRPLENML